MNDNPFLIEDIVRSFEWLGHSKHSLTELVAFHRDYRPGSEYYQTNCKQNLFPKIMYTKRSDEAINFVKRFYQNHTCCYGVNPRPKISRASSGAAKRAGDSDIEMVMNFYLDIDPLGEPSNEQIAEMEMFLLKTETFFEDLKIGQPVRAFTGRGYHLLFGIPPTSVKEFPDIKDRLGQFRQAFQKAFARDLSKLELKLDNTMDLSRLAKIYGTKKPGGRRVSRFYGEARTEDRALREHLLNLSVDREKYVAVKLPDSLPPGFERLLGHDEEVKQLWDGTGKMEGDTTNSGYDFSLISN